MPRNIFGGSLLAVCLALANNNAQAQVDKHRSEIGGVYTVITLSDFQSRLFPTFGAGNSTVSGLGGRFAFNFNNHLALDAETNFFPESHLLNEEVGEKMQGFIGLKAGMRKKKFGVFAKARPGVMWFGEFQTRGSCTSILKGTSCTVGHEKDFAMDVGGVFEFYPTGRLIIRADVGDTIVRYPDHSFGSLTVPIVVPADTKTNLQVSLGISWRF
jgi:hypothetical protein